MTTDADLAGLFPTMAAQLAAKPAADGAPASNAPEAKSVTEQQNDEAAKLYTSMQPNEPAKVVLPEGIAELRANDDNRIYDPQVMLAGADIEGALADVEGLDDATKTAAAREWREIAADMSMSVPEINQVATLAKQLTREPPTAETVEQWQQDAARRLCEVHGSEAQHALDLAKKVCARDPRALAFINANGLGSHPDVVLLMAELGMREHKRGRLK